MSFCARCYRRIRLTVGAAVQLVWSLRGLDVCVYMCVVLCGLVVCSLCLCVSSGGITFLSITTMMKSAVQTVHMTSSELPASGQ